MRKLRLRWKKWKDWKRYNQGSWLHKFCVLIGLYYSPTFEAWEWRCHR